MKKRELDYKLTYTLNYQTKDTDINNFFKIKIHYYLIYRKSHVPF